MTKGWNARTWHPRHLHAGPRRPTSGRTIIAATLVGLLALASGAVALVQSSTDSPAGAERIGICHATGSAEQPHVFIVVDRDGTEHAHHLQHPGDFIDVASEDECAPAVTPTAIELSTTDAHSATCPFHTEAPTAAPEAAEPEATEPAAPEAETVANESAVETTSAPAEEICEGDVALVQTGSIVGQRVVYVQTVQALGPDQANDVELTAVLPDTGRTWRLEGPDAGECLLEAREISCEFGDLLIGETKSVSASALHCSYDCGEDLSATGHAYAFNDRNTANDDATTVVPIADCPEAPSEAAPLEPAPAPEEPAAENTTGAPEAAPSNETAPENTTAPEPTTSDVRVSAVTTQDDVEAILTIRVSSLGPATATGVQLQDTLPDVRRPWLLSGADADACTLEGRVLTCWFGDLEPSEHRTVTVKAFTDRMACGHHLANTVSVAADNDTQAANNRSTTGIEAQPC